MIFTTKRPKTTPQNTLSGLKETDWYLQPNCLVRTLFEHKEEVKATDAIKRSSVFFILIQILIRVISYIHPMGQVLQDSYFHDFDT